MHYILLGPPLHVSDKTNRSRGLKVGKYLIESKVSGESADIPDRIDPVQADGGYSLL